MARIFKVCIVNEANENANEVFAVKPYLQSFDSFKEEVFIRMPELKNQPLKVYYRDEDGDNVNIYNGLDYGIFLDLKINKLFVKKSQAQTVRFDEAPIVPKTLPTTSAAPTASTPNLALHANVICDGCDKSIFGNRYKCLECHDFDLCMECEPKMHNQHLMVRIANPSDADICYRLKLGRRFLRHRRSESLCTKPEETQESKTKHHKRYGPSSRPCRTVGDVVFGVLQNLGAEMNSNANANANPNDGVAQGNETSTATSSGEPQATSAKTTPTSAPAYGFAIPSGDKPPCVPLKQSIDILSNMAHNFAAMMDPFATFMDHNASAFATAAAAATANAQAATSTASASNVVPSNAVPSNDSGNIEPMTGINSDQEPTNKEAQEKVADVMIVDCTDDEEYPILISSGSTNSSESKRMSPTAAASIDAFIKSQMSEKEAVPLNESAENDKGSPSREWTFIDKHEVAEAGAVGGSSITSTASSANSGAIPKKTTPPEPETSNNAPNVDFAELSRLLSTHMDAQNTTAPVAPTVDPIQADSGNNKSTKTPPPTPMHPDARVNEALNAMIAMGFSNEGGWLSQLLETVDGSISNALDLLQPQK